MWHRKWKVLAEVHEYTLYIVPYGCHHGMCFWFSCWRRATFVYCACRRCIWAQQILLFQWLRAHTGSCHNGQINKLRYPQAHRNYCTTALLRLQNKSSKHFFYFLINLSWIIHKLDDEKLCKILYSFFMKRQLLTNANEYFFFDSSVYKLVALVVRLGVERFKSIIHDSFVPTVLFNAALISKKSNKFTSKKRLEQKGLSL